VKYKEFFFIRSSGEYRTKMLREIHDLGLRGYLSILGTYQKVKKIYY
jgi:hypothetical protein